MNLKAIIFDLDGTLLDTLDEIAGCANQVLREKGFPTHDINAYRYFIGEGVTMLFKKALPENQQNDDVVQTCTKMFTEICDNRNRQSRITLYDGMDSLLDELGHMDIKTAILSNKPHQLTLKAVADFLSRWRFDRVLGQRDNVPRKPDPAGALEIARYFDLSPPECLYLGDTATDMTTATSAGMFPVGVLWGFRDKEELLGSGAQKVIHTPMDVIPLLNRADQKPE